LSGEVELQLGERMHIRAFGLDTHLEGDLRFRATQKREPRAEGELELVDGVFTAYGQELRIEPPLSADKVAATRLGIRLVNQLVLTGGLEADERIIAPDGSRLVLRPSRNRAIISVWRE
jgi:hypothetical protein